MKRIKHFLAAMLSATFNHLQYSDQNRKGKHVFWNDIWDKFIYFERRSNPYRPLE
ncbi:MAG: hypothetical protein ACYSTS_18860 [Planctomycetota bacterium]